MARGVPYTKEQQIGKIDKRGFGNKKSHLKKKSKKSLASNEEKEYLQFMKDTELPCVVCGEFATDLHHLKFDDGDRLHVSTVKKNHKLVIPLCRKHHIDFHGDKTELSKRFTKESLTTISETYYEIYLDTRGI